MIDITKIQDGDIFSISRKTFLGKAISVFMKMFAKTNHIKAEFIPTHQGILFWEGSILMIHESNKHGFKKREFILNYFESDDFIITRPKIPFTVIEKFNGLMYSEQLLLQNIKYQWLNFIAWVVYVLSFKTLDIFNRGLKETYCFEICARIVKKMKFELVTWDCELTDCFRLINPNDFNIILENHPK